MESILDSLFDSLVLLATAPTALIVADAKVKKQCFVGMYSV
mgnify:CR=1 FL=1